MAMNTDAMLNMLNDINLSALNDHGMFQELEVFAKELMNSSNPAHRFAALKINNRLQENPYYQNYLKTELIQKEEIKAATDKRFENAYQAHRENASIANVQNRKQEERKEKNENEFKIEPYKPNYFLYEKMFNKYGMSWNDLTPLEKNLFEKENEKSHIAINNVINDNEELKNLTPNNIEDAKNCNEEINAVVIAYKKGKITQEEYQEKIEENQRKLVEIFSADRDLSNPKTLEALNELREAQLILIENNKLLTPEEKKEMAISWKRETDAIKHISKIKKSIANGEEIEIRDIEFMLGALHTSKPNGVTIDVVKSLFNENKEVLDHVLKNEEYKKDFIRLLFNDGANKYNNLLKIIENNPEIDKILKEEYEIDLVEGRQIAIEDDTNMYGGMNPNDDIDVVTNNKNISSTIENHPNVGEKIMPSSNSIDENKQDLNNGVAIVKTSDF